jgi:DNA-binding transcriptional ArsR family regulator
VSTSDPKTYLADLEAVFAALSHPARRQILLTVKMWGGSMSAGTIAGRFAHAWPTTTRHIRILEDAGLLTQKKEGRTRIYTLNKPRLDVMRDWLKWFEDGNQEKEEE